MKSAFIGALTLAGYSLGALTGCSKNIDTIDSVKQGVLHDIPKDVNVGAMDVSVVSVSFRGQEADAVVSFAPKGGPPMMSMNYTMERKGNEWHIKKRATGDLQKHAGQAAGAAGSAGPIDGNTTDLPPGHPATGGGTPTAPPIRGDSTQLPPGHPPLDGSKK
ncbi:MAG: hypothetical protein ABUS49_08965 [Acidobacteriota bacterium]